MSQVIASAGILPIVQVLFVADYSMVEYRQRRQMELHTVLSNSMPSKTIKMAVVEGPFQDLGGCGMWFEAKAIFQAAMPQRIKNVRRDIQTAILHLGRAMALHKPKILIGEGQGAFAALCLARPACMDNAIQSRNVQVTEAYPLTEAWGKMET